MQSTTRLVKKFKGESSQNDSGSGNSQKNKKRLRTQSATYDELENIKKQLSELRKENNLLNADREKLLKENNTLKIYLKRARNELNHLQQEKSQLDKDAIEQKIKKLSERLDRENNNNKCIIGMLSTTIAEYTDLVKTGKEKIVKLEREKDLLATKSAETERQLRKELHDLHKCFAAIAGHVLDDEEDPRKQTISASI